MTSAWQASSVDCAHVRHKLFLCDSDVPLASATDLTIQVNRLPDANDPLIFNPTSWKMVTVWGRGYRLSGGALY